MATDLKTTKATITNIIKTLADKCNDYHKEYVANGFIDTQDWFEGKTFERTLKKTG